MKDDLRFPTATEAALHYVRVYNHHDTAALRALYSDEFRVQNPLWSGWKSVDEAVATLEYVWETLPGARFDLRNLVATGEIALIEFDFVWHDNRPETMTANSGRPLEHRMPVADVLHVVDGKLVGLRAYMNSDLMAQWLTEMDSNA